LRQRTKKQGGPEEAIVISNLTVSAGAILLTLIIVSAMRVLSWSHRYKEKFALQMGLLHRFSAVASVT
jgi:hypothetical protein